MNNSGDLTAKKCLPCEGGVPSLNETEIKDYLSQLKTKWDVVNNLKIKKEFKFKTFKQGIEFVNKVAQIAEAEGHHPDILIHYNKVTLELWTHKINGLSENDFILAAKIELISQS